MSNPFEGAEIISAYSRSQAIDDGFLIDVSERAREAGFKVPVAVTSAVWAECVEWNDANRAFNDEGGRLWDVIFMARCAIASTGRWSEIRLSNGMVVKVDPEDAARLTSLGPWHYHEPQKPGATGYARRNVGRGRAAYMHRVLLDPPQGYEVDHVNGDGLDNRRSNLRLATRSQQVMNQGVRSDSSSGSRGVSWDVQTGKWRARLIVGGRHVNLGRFGTVEEAKAAYVEAAAEHFGPYRHGAPDTDRAHFEVLRVPNRPDTIGATPVRCYAVCGPGDTAEPVITILLEGED